MKQEFEFKKIELFESLSEVDDFINDCDNDEVYANKPYYSHHGYDDDKRGYIGYIYWDPSTNTLKHTNKNNIIKWIQFHQNGFGYGEEERNLEGIDDTTKWSDHSGGLSINVGKFLDIGSDDYMIPPHEDPTLYYDDGKLNVRINELYGLKNDGNNKIRINTYNHKVIDTNIANGGIGFNTSETQKGGIYVLRGLGIKATKYNQAGSNYELNPYAIGVNIIDHSTGILDKPTTLSPDGKVVSAPEYRKFYGGLRYINKTDTAESGIAVRVNEDDSWDENPNLAIGSRGLGISPTNVLGIQFYKSENYHNPLIIKSVEESIEDKYAKKIILPSTTITKASGNDFPRPGEVDRVYVTSVNDRVVHFIWNPNTNTYEHMFEFVGSLPTTGVHNKVYVINGTDSIDLYTWGNLKTVLFPDINGDNVVNASDSHLIMEYYLDISSGKQPSLNEEQIKRADVTHSGAVDTSDSTWVSEFYADSSAGIYTNDIIGWRAFMKTKNIEDEPQGEGFNKIYSETESIPGIALEHDINRGLHVDDDNKLTVSINDVTSKSFEEYTDFNSGGLRFSSSGNIAIRLNDSNNYDADTGLGDDNIVNGTKGLCIDENNILGIKLNPTSSPLKIDDDGNLTLSEDIDVDTDIEPLTIKDSNDNIITFDGKTPVTITLGPGLEILPD
ncbi:unnamed protein product [Cylicocyclus nassatus]|uniref:Dockerin domain-containing protein n=1 Tax=Cylicocyclus nassatus TaxID=53992 RepID=A0AA36DT34_CYLNA|nr:unnamed protein product [Cylicocyclus nassatus]